MKRLITLVLFFGIALTACSTIAQNPLEEIKITDALGREVLFESSPERIVIAGRQTPMLANFLFLFETAPEKIIGIERRIQSTDDFLKYIDPSIGTKYQLEKGAGVEQIAPLEPDVVILKTSMRESIGIPLEEVGIAVVYIEFESIEQIYRDLKIFAELMNEEDRGEQLIAKYKKVKSDVDELITQKGNSSAQTVAVLQAENQDDQIAYSVPSVSWLQTSMINELDAAPVWEEAAQAGGWTSVNIEQILNWDPDKIFIINYQGNALSLVEGIKEDELWSNITAVSNDRVFAFPHDFLSWDQPDPRWILGYSWLASRIYQDLVPTEKVHEVIQLFFTEFYSLNADTFVEVIEPRISGYFE